MQEYKHLAYRKRYTLTDYIGGACFLLMPLLPSIRGALNQLIN